MSSHESKGFVEGASQSRPASTTATATQKARDRFSRSEIIAALSERFELLKPAGIRGNALCYLAEDLQAMPLNALVRLKVFAGQSDGDSREFELFNLESRAAAKLSHRNVLKASQIEQKGDACFSVIEHRAGAETLKDLLDREAWLNLKLAVGIILQLTDALDYAHRQGVLHLAINPESILIDRDGTALVGDFGIETGDEYGWAHAERSRRSDPRYISPEQASGKSVDERSDLYSLGVLIYKMLTDRLPFEAEDDDAIRHKQINQSPLPPHLFCANVPLWMSSLIMCLLDKNRSRRFQSADALRSALNEFAVTRLGIIKQHEISPPQIEGAETQYSVAASATQKLDRFEPKIGQEKTEKSSAAPAAVESARAIEREDWETPSITVIDPPLEQLSITAKEQSGNGASQLPEMQADAPQKLESAAMNRLAEMAMAEDTSRKQWRRWILIVALAVAVAGGLMALARSHNIDRASQNQPTVEAPAVDNHAIDSNKGATTPSSGDDGSLITREQPSINQQLESTKPAMSNPTVLNARPRAVRPAASRRAHLVRRNQQRAKRHWPRRVRRY
ncbi:MAG TPA: serine/threonine-protein kinase [Blastocatellia bacterium]|nr:serine/threonine-protein kinase [Blastocatellia bacterium]